LGLPFSNNLIGVQQGLADVTTKQEKSKELKKKVDETKKSRVSYND